MKQLIFIYLICIVSSICAQSYFNLSILPHQQISTIFSFSNQDSLNNIDYFYFHGSPALFYGDDSMEQLCKTYRYTYINEDTLIDFNTLNDKRVLVYYIQLDKIKKNQLYYTTYLCYLDPLKPDIFEQKQRLTVLKDKLEWEPVLCEWQLKKRTNYSYSHNPKLKVKKRRIYPRFHFPFL